MAALQQLTATARWPAKSEIIAPVFIYCAHCLRARRAVTAHADLTDIVFIGTKTRAREQSKEMGPWTARWADFLVWLRALHGYQTERPAWFQGRNGLHDGLRASLSNLNLNLNLHKGVRKEYTCTHSGGTRPHSLGASTSQCGSSCCGQVGKCWRRWGGGRGMPSPVGLRQWSGGHGAGRGGVAIMQA